MKLKNKTLILVALGTLWGLDCLGSTTSRKTPPEMSSVAAPESAPLGLWEIGSRFVFWQENVIGQELGKNADFTSQFRGFALGLYYRQSLGRPRWIHHFHGTELSLGGAQAIGRSHANLDRLREQPWWSISANPGVFFSLTKVSGISLSIPLVYRAVNWNVARPTLLMDKSNSFTVGTTINMSFKILDRLTITGGMGRYYMWDATLWQMGFNYIY